MIGKIRRISAQETERYRYLSGAAVSIISKVRHLQNTNSTSMVVCYPLGNQARPMTGLPQTGADTSDLEIQDALWTYIREVDTGLERYQWDAALKSSFKLGETLQRHGNISMDQCVAGLEEYKRTLEWMAQRKVYNDVARKLAALQTLEERPPQLRADLDL
jgi:hypothetical protein